MHGELLVNKKGAEENHKMFYFGFFLMLYISWRKKAGSIFGASEETAVIFFRKTILAIFHALEKSSPAKDLLVKKLICIQIQIQRDLER